MERNLIDYLPNYLKEYKEIQAITNTEQTEISSLWNGCDDVMSDQYINDATENGVERWESMLKIYPKDTDTLEERRFRILASINKQLPYTYRMLDQLLLSLCGVDGYRTKLTPSEYSIVIKLAMANENNYNYVVELLDRMLPCNMEFSVTMFNTHGIISDYTYGQLAQYTHQQLREDVM